MSRSKAEVADTKGVRDRLRRFVKEWFSDWNDFTEKLVVPRTTSDGWRSKKGSSIPDSAWLLRLAQETNLSIDWLLLGEGPMLRQKTAANPREQVRNAIEAELRQTESLPPQLFQGTWDRMSIRADMDRLTIDDVVFRLAVDAVRVRFHETLRLVMHYALVAFVYDSFRRLHMSEEANDATRAEEARRRFQDVLAAPLGNDLNGLWRVLQLHGADLGLLRLPRQERVKSNAPTAK